MPTEMEHSLVSAMISVRSLEPSRTGSDTSSSASESLSCPCMAGQENTSGQPSCSMPVLEGTLEDLLRAGACLNSPRLDSCMDELQESSLDSLYSLLAAAGINREERLVISLDTKGALDVGEHPQKIIITAALAAHPDIAARMRLMAALALTERGMEDLERAKRMIRANSSTLSTSSEHTEEKLFQACLKGPLSHFHLVRKN